MKTLTSAFTLFACVQLSAAAEMSYQIIVRKDLSIAGVANKHPADKVGTGKPATPANADSEGGDKPQPKPEKGS